MDIKKAYNTVPIQRVIFKLEKLGVRERLLTWIKDFLTDQMSCCSVRGERSAWCSVGSGVPHDTVLVPVLFLVFINDLLECIRLKIKLFADDAKLYRNIKEKEDHNILQEDLNNYCN